MGLGSKQHPHPGWAPHACAWAGLPCPPRILTARGPARATPHAGKWLEVLGCGVMQQQILDANAKGNEVGGGMGRVYAWQGWWHGRR